LDLVNWALLAAYSIYMANMGMHN